MKSLKFLAALPLCLLLAACTTDSSTRVTTYDNQGNAVTSTTSSSHTNETMEAVAKAGEAVKDGAVAGYEWSKDKATKGYNWVQEKFKEQSQNKQ